MTWEPGIPLYQRPDPHGEDGMTVHWQDLIVLRPDSHDDLLESFGHCGWCDDDWFLPGRGLVWKKLFKGART